MATEIEQVRALIGDDEAPYTFSDTTVAAFLELYESNVFRAGGNLLMRAAVDVGLTAKMVRTDDLTVDNTMKADILFKRAELLLAGRQRRFRRVHIHPVFLAGGWAEED